MKKCPYCAEEIQDEAILCRYCRMEIAPNKMNVTRPIYAAERGPLPVKKTGVQFWPVVGGLVVAEGVSFVIGFGLGYLLGRGDINAETYTIGVYAATFACYFGGGLAVRHWAPGAPVINGLVLGVVGVASSLLLYAALGVDITLTLEMVVVMALRVGAAVWGSAM